MAGRIARIVALVGLAGVLAAPAQVWAGRWHGHRFGHHHGHRDAALALGITGAIVGSALLADVLVGRPQVIVTPPHPYYGGYYPYAPCPPPYGPYWHGYRDGFYDGRHYRRWYRYWDY